jgi:hypothetical protein
LAAAINFPPSFEDLIYDLGEAIELGQKTVRQAPASAALLQAEKDCYIACQQAFTKAESSLGIEASPRLAACQPTIKHQSDAHELSDISESIAALSVPGDEPDMHADEPQSRQYTEKPLDVSTQETTSPAHSNYDLREGEGRAQAKRGATDIDTDGRRVRHSPYPLRDRHPTHKHG